MTERGVHRRPRILEGVVGIRLVPVHHPDPLGPVFSADHEVAGQGELVDAQALPQPPHREGVPGQLTVMVAGEHHHVVVGVGGEVGHRLGELGVGIEDQVDVGRPGQHLETVPGDEEGGRAVALPQDVGDLVGHSRRRGGGHGREVEIADQNGTAPDGQLQLDPGVDEGGGQALLRAPGGRGSFDVRLRVGRPVGYGLGLDLRRGDLCQLAASGRIMGKRITSRMASTSANSMMRRSMPMPIPEVGGKPYSSARTKARSAGWASRSP